MFFYMTFLIWYELKHGFFDVPRCFCFWWSPDHHFRWSPVAQVHSPSSLGSFSSDSTVHVLGEALLRAREEGEHPMSTRGNVFSRSLVACWCWNAVLRSTDSSYDQNISPKIMAITWGELPGQKSSFQLSWLPLVIQQCYGKSHICRWSTSDFHVSINWQTGRLPEAISPLIYTSIFVAATPLSFWWFTNAI